MSAELTVRAESPAESGGVEVEYVDPGRGRERRPLAACCSSRFERTSPVRVLRHFGVSGTGRAGGGSPAPGRTSVMSRGWNATC